MDLEKTTKRLRPEEKEKVDSVHLNLQIEDSFDRDDQKDDQDYNAEVNQNQTNNKKSWSNEQEISILKGLIRFSTEKGLDPLQNKTKFFTFIKELIPEEDFTKKQLNSKLRSFKRKFNNLMSGEGKVISTPHEEKVFELLKRIWVTDIVEPHEPKCNLPLLLYGSGNYETTRVNLDENFDELGENVVEKALGLLGETKRIEFKREWEQLQTMELELSVKRAKLVQFQTEIILDAYNKSSTK